MLKNNKHILIILAAGTLLGIWSFLSMATIVTISLFFGLVIFIYSFVDPSERKFLLTLSLTSFFIRIILIVFITYLIDTSSFLWANDGESAYMRGLYIYILSHGGENLTLNLPNYRYLAGLKNIIEQYNNMLPEINSYQVGLHTYIIGFFLNLFGYSFQVFRVINSVLITLGGIFLYFIVRDTVDKKNAKLASWFFVLYPSIIFWSITNIREPIIISMSIIFLWSCINLLKKNNNKYLVPIVITCSLNILLRKMMIIPLGMVMIFVGVNYLKMKFRINYSIMILIIILCTTFVLIINIINSHILEKKAKIFSNLELIIHKQVGIVLTSQGKTNYKIYPERFYKNYKNLNEVSGLTIPELFYAFFKGSLYLIFAPFPWNTITKSQIYFYPQIIIWYFLIPFSFLGLIKVIRFKMREFMPIIIFCIVSLSFFALVEGNVGTLIRHRDLISPFIFIFASTGLLGLGLDSESTNMSYKNE